MAKKPRDKSKEELVLFLGLDKIRSEINEVLASDASGVVNLNEFGKYLKGLSKESKIKQSWILDVSQEKPIAQEKAMHLLNGINMARKKCKLPTIKAGDAIKHLSKSIDQADGAAATNSQADGKDNSAKKVTTLPTDKKNGPSKAGGSPSNKAA